MGQKNDQDNDGPRSFVKFLADLGDGYTARDLSIDLRNLERELHDKAIAQDVTVKGELAIKLKFKTEKNGVCTVGVESKVTLPKFPTSGGVMWHDPKTGHLGASNPKQTEFKGLREVARGRASRNDDDDDASGGTH